MLHRHFRDFCSFYAREVRNFFKSAVVSQADRLYGQTGLSDEDLCRLEESNFKYKKR